MTPFEKALYFLFPGSRLSGTPWRPLWVQHERRSVLSATRVALGIAAAAYVAHHFFVDVPLGLQPASLWNAYRFGVAGFFGLCFYLTYLPAFAQGSYYRWPVTVGLLVASVMQARSSVWYSGAHYAYAIVIPCLGAMILQDSQLKSALFLGVAYALEAVAFRGAHLADSRPVVLSAYTVGAVGVLLLRARMPTEIDAFIAAQDRSEAQKQLIESQLELTEQIRAFLPREVYRRVTHMIETKHYSVLQAMDEALRPRLCNVACVFSDIRGYTQQSKDVTHYIPHSALPNMRVCTEIAESHGGIPRLVGDLIFSYFDSESPRQNLARALQCGFEFVKKTVELNRTLPEGERVKRYVLVSLGRAVVGNIGGGESAREITALGPPVNVLSRIDVLTKDPTLAPYLSTESLILTSAAAELARQLTGIQLFPLRLDTLGLSIRDFPDETTLWLCPTAEHLQSLRHALLDIAN